MSWYIQIITLIVLFGGIQNASIDDKRKPVQLAYNSFEPIYGSQHQTPIVFLHGITSSKESWGDLTQRVADTTGRMVYRIDARNHGESPWTDQFDFDLNVVDFIEFLNSINATKAILVGHSMGGITSMKTALKYPNRIEKLIVEDMTPRHLPQSLLDGISAYLQKCQEAAKQIIPGTSLEEAKERTPGIINVLLSNAERTLIKPSPMPMKMTHDGKYCFKTNFGQLIESLKDVNKLYPKIKSGKYEGPACFIYGKNSPIKVGDDEALIKGFFPKAKLIGIDHASHGVHAQNPVAFRAKLFECLLH